MADFDDWHTDADINGDGADDGAPSVQGGLLDASTFPPSGPPAGDDGLSLDRPAPAITEPLDTDVHAQVLQDIQDAQSKLPPVQSAAAVGIGLRHIDPYPGMNYTPPGGYPPLTQQAAADFLNGVPLPKDAFGPHIRFNNDVAGGPSTDRPVTNALASMVEQGVVDSGFHTVNVNSSVRPSDGSQSNHPKKRAVDINNIDGFRVLNRPDLAGALQNTFAQQPGIRENYGPAFQVETYVPGQHPVAVPKVKESHRNHDHFSVQE